MIGEQPRPQRTTNRAAPPHAFRVEPRKALVVTVSVVVAVIAVVVVLSHHQSGPSHRAPVIPAATQYTGVGVSVSCPDDRFCMIMNADGDYATYTGPGTAPSGP